MQEHEVSGEIFQVTHRILQVPRATYLEVLAGHEKPFSESGAQQFVEKYLAWCGDKNGILGMVRIDEKDGAVILDAAIRYRINPLERPSCHS
ncbi:MAG TPA: hypothetical protein GX699_12045 [Firmicutes bacterium]|nr:hypothetical protein [Bacillota bacterium]